jgi:pimeloyl-ACP methyl ester carboxylesterase
MGVFEVREDELVDEVIDVGRREALRRRSLVLPGAGRQPPLAVEETVAPRGATLAPVALVHGFAQNKHTWRISGRSFSGFLAARGHRVLNLELRGHGDSRRAGSPSATSFDDYVDDLVRVVELAGAPPLVIGHSLGAAVALGAATRVPVAGVVHLAGVYRFAGANRTLRALARLSLEVAPGLSAARASTGLAGRAIGRLYSFTDLFGYGLPFAGWAPGSMEPELLRERLAVGFDWTSVEVWLQMSRWATGEPFGYAEAVTALDLPLLVAVGDADPLAPPADARPLYEQSASSDKTWLELGMYEHGVRFGHLDLVLGREAPRIVWPLLGDWLATRGGR